MDFIRWRYASVGDMSSSIDYYVWSINDFNSGNSREYEVQQDSFPDCEQVNIPGADPVALDTVRANEEIVITTLHKFLVFIGDELTVLTLTR